MNHENVYFINGQKGIDISKGGLYSPWPIPAAQVLMQNKEWAALRVLTCLITYLGYGKSSSLVWPRIETICNQTGLGKKSVQAGIKALITFGFIVKHKKPARRFQRNEYEILDACYNFDKMNEYAKSKSSVKARVTKNPESSFQTSKKQPNEPSNKLQDNWQLDDDFW
jgi:hypothetical protein